MRTGEILHARQSRDQAFHYYSAFNLMTSACVQSADDSLFHYSSSPSAAYRRQSTYPRPQHPTRPSSTTPPSCPTALDSNSSWCSETTWEVSAAAPRRSTQSANLATLAVFLAISSCRTSSLAQRCLSMASRPALRIWLVPCLLSRAVEGMIRPVQVAGELAQAVVPVLLLQQQAAEAADQAQIQAQS